ncbi:MAG: ferritin-like domain-containing protein [Vicinamibacteraceae bacterium]
MAALNTLHPLFVTELKDLLDAEHQLTRALPRLMKSAQSDKLRDALEMHLDETKEHVERLTGAFEALGERASAKTCAGMRGIIKEADEDVKADADGAVRDAAIIGAAQKAEHYEIAAYGTARTHAVRLGFSEVAQILEQTLKEEKRADKKLTEIAEAQVNPQAVEGEAGAGARGGAAARARRG